MITFRMKTDEILFYIFTPFIEKISYWLIVPDVPKHFDWVVDLKIEYILLFDVVCI